MTINSLNNELSHDFYYLFSQEDDYYVQLSLISQLDLPEELLIHIAGKTKYIDVMVGICGHPNSPTILLEQFRHVKNDSIIKALASNKNTPSDYLINLTKSNNKDVSFLAKNNLNLD